MKQHQIKKPSDNCKPNPVLYPTMSDIVNQINRKLQDHETYEKNQSAYALRINNITQRVSSSLPNENSLFIIFRADLCIFFRFKEAFCGTGVFKSGAGPHFPKLPHCPNKYLKDLL